MPQPALRIVLTDDERETLTAWSRSTAGEHRMVERSRIILLAAEGLPAREIARRLKTRLDECPSGDGGSGRIGFPAWKMRQGRGNRKPTTRRPRNEFSPCWMLIHRRDTASGTAAGWPRNWEMSATIRFGVFFANIKFSSSGGGVGAFQPIPNSDPRPQMSSACT